jgi:hypothetical protein
MLGIEFPPLASHTYWQVRVIRHYANTCSSVVLCTHAKIGCASLEPRLVHTRSSIIAQFVVYLVDLHQLAMTSGNHAPNMKLPRLVGPGQSISTDKRVRRFAIGQSVVAR